MLWGLVEFYIVSIPVSCESFQKGSIGVLTGVSMYVFESIQVSGTIREY